MTFSPEEVTSTSFYDVHIFKSLRDNFKFVKDLQEHYNVFLFAFYPDSPIFEYFTCLFYYSFLIFLLFPYFKDLKSILNYWFYINILFLSSIFKVNGLNYVQITIDYDAQIVSCCLERNPLTWFLCDLTCSKAFWPYLYFLFFGSKICFRLNLYFPDLTRNQPFT